MPFWTGWPERMPGISLLEKHRARPSRQSHGGAVAKVDPNVFSLRLTGTDDGVRAALLTMSQELACRACPAPLRSDSEIVAGEVLNNIVEHALVGQPEANRSIHLLCQISAEGLSLRFSDHGRPMPEGHAPQTSFPPVDVPLDDLPEGGFGWAIVNRIARQVSYRRSGGRNLLSLHLPV